IYSLANYAKKLIWETDGKKAGVIGVDLISPSTVDNIEQGGLGTVRFEWLMESPPSTRKEALAIREKAKRLPMLNGTLVSDSGDALAIYIPISSKNVSYAISQKLRSKIAEFTNGDRYFITGLPVAQDTFGKEMFVQMAISAPMAMLLIFLLMMYFFRKASLVLSPLLVAIISVISTMGLLVISGNTIHIMSSMIPIFIMPIAVLDSVHILSEFFDRYQSTKDRYQTINTVMKELFSPMLYTSLTTFCGFASLALTPIPPVQVFGIFVAIGVAIAWLVTVTFIPAFVVLMKESSLENFGIHDESKPSLLSAALLKLGVFSSTKPKLLIAATCLLGVVSYYGIKHIQINDNPVKWFTKSHEIRVADAVLNKRFAGTYMAYLTFEYKPKRLSIDAYINNLKKTIAQKTGKKQANWFEATANKAKKSVADKKELLKYISAKLDSQIENAPDSEWEKWDEMGMILSQEQLSDQIFKQPKVLNYISGLQQYLLTTGLVGKSTSLADLVKTIHRELLLGDQKEYRIPATPAGVAQTLISFQNSHRPDDLWHLVTPNFQSANIWIQLKSGDNKDMSALTEAVEGYISRNPPPVPLTHKWFGLTYINVIWQRKMVRGMAEAFASSFLVVFILMVILFRSVLWGILSMVPLSVTIAATYGLIGLVGKDYDMPIAVLSSLSLGLAVDYAIHFLARIREIHKNSSSWSNTIRAMFGEPARAITRNVIVVGTGFLPLLAAPLVPYKTVGFFISSILVLAGVATLVLLPALLAVLHRFAFKVNS
ncbi:MAG: RND transporter, partial [Candidatus Dadabacteria bacterium]